MNKFATIIAGLMLTFSTLTAQTLDTISIGSGYGQQVWYKFEGDVETKKSILEYDLAFSTRLQRDAAIHTSPYTTLYKAIAPASAWSTVSIDLNTLVPQTGVDTSWSWGAMNLTGDNIFNYGWGNYNTTTHHVNGDSIYVIKTQAGTYKKLIIDRLSFDTAYFFRHADIDGKNEVSDTLNKKNFSGKNYGYYSIDNKKVLDREPLSKDWDIVAARYYGLTPDQNGVLQSYPLTGILQNDGVKVAKVIKRDTASDSFADLSFKDRINTIGSDWKSFSTTTNKWTLADSTAYFVRAVNGKIYKVIFTGFGGSTTGNMIFTREAVKTTNVQDVKNGLAALAIYPNPATDGNITLVYDLGKNTQTADIQLFNISGQSVYSQKIGYTDGLQQLTLPQLNLNAGIYFARIAWNGQSMTQKVIVR